MTMRKMTLILMICAVTLALVGSLAAQSETRASRIISETIIREWSGDTDSDPIGMAVLSDDSLVFFETEAGSFAGSDGLIHVDWAAGTFDAPSIFNVIASEVEIQALRGGTDNATVRDVASDADDNVYIVATGGDQAIIRIADSDPGAAISFGSPVSLVAPGSIGSGLATDSQAIDIDSVNDIAYVLVDTLGLAEDLTTNGIYMVTSSSTATGATLSPVASYSNLHAVLADPTSPELGTDIFGVGDICVLPDGNLACIGSELPQDSDPADGTVFLIADPSGSPSVSVLITGSNLESSGGTNFGNNSTLIDCDADGNLFLWQHGGQLSPDNVVRYIYSGGSASFAEVYAEESAVQDIGGYALFTTGPIVYTPDVDDVDARGFAVGQNMDLWLTIDHDSVAASGTRGIPTLSRIRNYASVTSNIEGRVVSLLDEPQMFFPNTEDDDYDSDPSGCAVLSTRAVAFFESEPNDAAGEVGSEDSILLWAGSTVTVIAGEAAIRAADPNSSISTDDTADMRFADICADASDNLYVIMFENVTSGDNSAGEEFIFRIPSTGPNTFGAPERIVVVNDGPTGSDGAVAIDVDNASNRLCVLRDAGGINQQTEVPVNPPDGTNTGIFYLSNPGTIAAGDNALTQAVSGTAIANAVTPAQTPDTVGMDDLVVRSIGGSTDIIVSVPYVLYDAALGGLDGDLVTCDPVAGTASLLMDSATWTAVLDALTANSLVEGVTLEAGDIDNDDGDEEIILLASGIDGEIDADIAETREGLIMVSSDGTSATLLASQLDLYLEAPRLAGGGDLLAFGNAMSIGGEDQLLHIMFANQVESLIRIFLGEFTATDSWSVYR
jgi:hypothetical protein